MSKNGMAAVAAMSLALSGCGVDLANTGRVADEMTAGHPAPATPDSEAVGATAERDVAVLSQSLDSTTIDTNWISGPSIAGGDFTWNQGDLPQSLKNAGSHVCVLTRVSGRFAGGGEQLRLYVDGGAWFLGGKSQQQGLSASAHCFSKAGFSPAGSTSSHSEEFATEMTSSGCHQRSRNTWWGDTFTFVTGMSGGFFGLGEFVRTEQSEVRDLPSRLLIQNCAGSSDGRWYWLWGAAHSFYVGPGGGVRQAKFWGPKGKGSAAQAGVYKSKFGGTRMTPVNQTMCGFTHVGGSFNGAGEWLAIYPKDGYWFIEGRAQSGQGLAAEALCYLRDQDTCTDSVTSACAAFGCGCANDTCSGGACPGTGCTAQQTQGCAAFGCGCSLGKCSGGSCGP